MNIKRRPRGSLKDPVPVGWAVERASKEHFAELATRAGYTSAAFLDLMMNSIDLDEHGTPTWVPKKIREGQLPIDKA